MSLNKVLLMGNLGKDPELRMTTSQMPVCQFSLATSEKRKDASGNFVEQTEWHNIVTFGKTAENCAKYIKKGSSVFIDGRIQTRKWQDKEGKDRYTTEIIANTVQFLSRSQGASQQGAIAANGGGYSPEQEKGREMLSSLPTADSMSSNEAISFDDDDIPF